MQDLQSQKLIVIAHRKMGLYVLDELKVPPIAAIVKFPSFYLSHSSSSSFYLWHSRLGHVLSSRSSNLRKLETHEVSNCSGCKLPKFSTFSYYQMFMMFLNYFRYIKPFVLL